MKTLIRRSMAALAGLLAAASVLAQAYPAKPLSLVVPYPAGGPSDAIARIFNTALGKELGQTVLVENLGGVSGALAAQKVLAAPADGYNLFQGSPNEVILAPIANAAVKVKAEDFRLLQPVTDGVMVLVVRKDLAANNADELIALAKRPGATPLTYGSVGIGSLYHLVIESMQQRTGTNFTHVPYKGNAPLLQDLSGGQVDFAVLIYSAGMGALAEQGRLKVIGQLSARRSELLNSVPAVAEGQALKDFAFRTWTGFMVPRSTPEPVVQQLHQALGRALADPGVRAQLAAQTMQPSAPMSLPDAARFFEAETAGYRTIARAINLQPQ